MEITELTVQRLKDAATAGDHLAARDLGRLLGLLAIEEWEPGRELPEARWLRAAVDAAPGDPDAVMLLAGQRAKEFSYFELSLELNPWHQADIEVFERLRGEAHEWYRRARAVGVREEHEAGLDELARMLGVDDKPPAGDVYSYYLLRGEAGSGSMVYVMTVVGADIDAFMWACDQVITNPDLGIEEADSTITAHVDGAEIHASGLALRSDGKVDWDSVALPDLTGVPLPPGLPVPGRGLHYGFFVAQ